MPFVGALRRASMMGLILLGAPGTVLAEPPAAPGVVPAPERTAAREAYTAGLRASEQGEYRRAAELFAEADRLEPHAVSLRSALKAAIVAGDPLLAMGIAERAAGRSLPDDVRELVALVQMEHGPALGRIVLRCPGVDPCQGSVDGGALSPGVPRWVSPGRKDVALAQGTRRTRVVVSVTAGGLSVVAPPDAARRKSAVSEAPATTPGAWLRTTFWVGLGATSVLSAAAIASAVDTEQRHDLYLETGNDADEGRASQTRTNVLFFSAVGLAAATVVSGILGFGVYATPAAGSSTSWPTARF
jgi:hypothetical protein